MSFDNEYPNHKDWRRPYRRVGSKRSCRNHGSCGWCHDTRTYQDRKGRQAAGNEIKNWKEGDDG